MNSDKNYLAKRKKLRGVFFETALPNEYLVVVGNRKVEPILGGRKFKLFKRILRVPAYVQRLYFKTDNANIDYQGIAIEGYASWRINPKTPEIAISTLDFFDENDPMEKTNEDLKTICIEAVRHVIANMSIEDAIRKKDEIAESLKLQLKSIEERWGIVFDNVGIEKVSVMSSKVFQDLQAEYRNQLRLNSEKQRLAVDKEISSSENSIKEEIMFQKLQSERKIKEKELSEKEGFLEKERLFKEAIFRKDSIFEAEKKEKNSELEELDKKLKLKMIEIENRLLESELKLQKTKLEIEKEQLQLDKLKIELKQHHSSEELINIFINKLPEIMAAQKIDNLSILQSGDNNISPITKTVNEILQLLKNEKIFELINKK
ncbi:hypothetical protein JXR93_08185 [bacterium]|nr:hypothetical protein [bacterium]